MSERTSWWRTAVARYHQWKSARRSTVDVWVVYREWSVIAVASSEERLWTILPDDFMCAPSGKSLVGSHRDCGIFIEKVTLDGPPADLRRQPPPPPPDPDRPSSEELRDLQLVVESAECTDLAVLLRAAKWLPVRRYRQNAYWRARVLFAEERDEPVYLTQSDDSEIRTLLGTFSPSAEKVLGRMVVANDDKATEQRAALEERRVPVSPG
jgi:hypothetical protein